MRVLEVQRCGRKTTRVCNYAFRKVAGVTKRPHHQHISDSEFSLRQMSVYRVLQRKKK